MRGLFDSGVSITFIHPFEVAAIVVEKEDKEGRGRTGCLISDLLEGGRERLLVHGGVFGRWAGSGGLGTVVDGGWEWKEKGLCFFGLRIWVMK